MLAINRSRLFQDLGFESALIYRRKDVETASHTAFWTVIVMSIAITALTIGFAPLIASFFRQPEVTPILQVLALTVLITSFGRVPLVLLSRDLDFRRRIFPELTSSVIASVVAIILAFRGYGVWSLRRRGVICRARHDCRMVCINVPSAVSLQSHIVASCPTTANTLSLPEPDLPDHERRQRDCGRYLGPQPALGAYSWPTTPPISLPPR